MHMYEYLFTAILIIAILVASSMMVMTFPKSPSNVSEREQLKEVAQKIMTQLLLSPGEPPEWGSDITLNASGIVMLGLAAYSYTTREAYVLDPDKVLRLNSLLQNFKPALYIQPQDAIHLLNLGNDYGFKIEFYPALNVTVDLDNYKVKVTSNYNGLPIVGANLVARLYYLEGSSQIVGTQLKTGITDYAGECILNFSEVSTDKKVLTLVVEYFGIQITTVVASQNVIDACFLGNYLLLNSGLSLSENNVLEIYITKDGEGQFTIKDIAYSIAEMGNGQCQLSYIEPSTKAILAVANDNLICALKIIPESYASIGGDVFIPFAYSVERTVSIDNTLWIVRLYVWRMSW